MSTKKYNTYINDSIHKLQKIIDKYIVANNLADEYDMYMSNPTLCGKLTAECASVVYLQTEINILHSEYAAAALEDGDHTLCINAVINRLFTLINKVKSIISKCDTEDLIAINSIEFGRIKDISAPEVSFVCCGKQMEIDEFMFEYICQHCGLTKVSNNIVRDEKQLYEINNNAVVSESYTHSRTLGIWIDNILGHVKYNLTKDEMDTLVSEIVPKYGQVGNAKRLSLEILRQIFKKRKMTKLNKYAASILSLFTGEHPPILSSIELEEMDKFYYKVINYIKSEPSITKKIPERNRTYCPYYIYKYAQITWRDDPVKLSIIKFIHIQEPDTVLLMEAVWMSVCNHFKFKYYKIRFGENMSFEKGT